MTLKEYPVELEPFISFDDWLKRGRYSYVDPNFKYHDFKLTKSGSRRIVLYEPKTKVRTEDIINAMISNRDHPACLDDALALAYKFPDEPGFGPVLFLGEETFFLRYGKMLCFAVEKQFPTLEYVYAHDGRPFTARELHLMVDRDCVERPHLWSAGYRFAAIRGLEGR